MKSVMYAHGMDFNKVRYTIAAVVSENEVKFGISICSKNDNFDKRIGRQIAEQRAKGRPFKKIELGSLNEKNVVEKMYSIISETKDITIYYSRNFNYDSIRG